MKIKNQKSKLTLLIVAVLLVVIACGLVIFYAASKSKTTTVYDFARTIQYDAKSNYAVKDGDICEAEILAGDMNDQYIVNKDEIIGKYITGTAYKGAHVLKSQLQSDPTYIDKSGIDELAEYRKIYLPIDYSKGFAGDIAAGQMVDIAYTDTGAGFTDERTEDEVGLNNTLQYATTKVFMQKIPVYQVYCADGSVYVKRTTDPMTLGVYEQNLSEDGKPDENYAAPAYVALTVTIPQFEEIEARRKFSEITLVSRFDTSQDVESNGYTVIKDSYAHIYTGEGNLEYDHGIQAVAEEIEKNGEKDKSEETETKVKKTQEGLYSFLRGLTKIQMNDDQLSRYNAIYTRYAEYMDNYAGKEWEVNTPDLVTFNDLLSNVDMSKEDELNALLGWKNDVTALAQELRGSGVKLPF